MNKVDFFEAWYLWANSVDLRDYYLWGMKILWWGRAGKITQFVAALAILVEIIGPETFRSFSAHFRINEIQAAQISIKAGRQGLRDEWHDSWMKTKVPLMALVLSFLVSIPVPYLLYKGFNVKSVIALALAYILTLIIWFLLATFVTLFLSYSYDVLPAFYRSFRYFIIAKPMSYVLERPNLLTLVKIVSLILFLLGFHFDLLAS